MHQRDRVKRAWEEAGLYQRREPKLRRFLQHVEEAPAECWPELIDRVHTQFAEHLEQIVLPIWESGDKLLRLNLIRAADLGRAEDRAFVTNVVRRLDPKEDEPELRALLHMADAPVLDVIEKRRDLPQPLKALVKLRRERMTP